MKKWVLTLIATLLLMASIFVIPVKQTKALSSNDLGIVPKLQRKDTYMLCLSIRASYPLTGSDAWDKPHQNRCDVYCTQASISMIVSYYGGNLSQDRITYFEFGEIWGHPPETDLYSGMSVGMTTGALSWTLSNATIEYQVGKPSLTEIKNWIDSGRPIMRLSGVHVTVIDGYDSDGGNYIHKIDPWTATEVRIQYEYLDIYAFWVPPVNATAHSDEPELWTDSDNDGIVDFDETMRFKTNPYNPDTDGDGIDDKTEIKSYTYIGDNFDSEDIRKPDTDGDGLRNEIDPDSDNGGTPDGLEDLDKDGVLDIGETDPFNPADDPYIPPPIASFQCDPEKPTANESIAFDASASYSEKGNITTYEWNFNDGNITTVTEPMINHTYTSPAKYNVTLTVTDNNTLFNSTTRMIPVYYRTDLNKDGPVNILDITIVALAYNSRPGDPKWNEIADLDKNEIINILDIAMVAKDFGKTT